MHLRLFLLLCALTVAVQGYHILCIFPIASKSHNILGAGIVNSLLEAGHEVTWVTPYPPDKAKERLTIIDASATRPITESIDMTKTPATFGFIRDMSNNITIITNAIPALRQAMVTQKFDAVVTETFFTDLDAGYAAVLQVPWISLSSSILQPIAEALVDEVRSVPVHPLMFNEFDVPMTFFERAWNVILYNILSFFQWMDRGSSEALYNQMFSDIARARNIPLPPYADAVRNLSILFVNSHPSVALVHSVPPNVVDIGGYHIEDSQPPLPKDLQDLMDSSSRGVVYFSMGSVLRSSAFSDSTKRALIKVLGDLPYTVLWKFEEDIKDLPENVHVKSWMPQASILAHNNTKLFITHGGMLSNLETLKYGVPLISIPFFGDQPANAARAVHAGYAVRVKYDPDSLAGDLGAALKEMLGNDKYTKRVKYLSALFNKRPVAPRKLIVHYIEEAIVTQGAHHLRSSAKLYKWYQLWMLDLLAALLLTLYIVYRIAKIVIKTIVRKVMGGEKKIKIKRN